MSDWKEEFKKMVSSSSYKDDKGITVYSEGMNCYPYEVISFIESLIAEERKKAKIEEMEAFRIQLRLAIDSVGYDTPFWEIEKRIKQLKED